MSKKKIKLNILGLSYSQTQSGAYALVLAEEEGERRIPIIIGGVEAQSIAIKLEGLEPPRPLTHDLFLNFSRAFEIEVSEVIIYKLEEGIFYSELICIKNGEELRIDSRTSDAVALSLRFDCPIYTYESIIETAGIVLDANQEQEVDLKTEDRKTTSVAKTEKYSSMSIDELNNSLKDAVNKEDYEQASKIRDEIQKRSAS